MFQTILRKMTAYFSSTFERNKNIIFMPRLSQITHTDSNTERKVNFFSDYFKNYSHLIGKNPDFPFDNLLSVCCRLEYQIRYNKSNRTKYIPHLATKYRSFDNGISQKFPLYKIVYTELELFESVTSNKNRWLSNNAVLNNELFKLRENLDKSFFSKSLEELIIALRCSHKLITHKELIKVLTQNLVTELLFEDRTQKEVEKVMLKIMSDDKNSFPLSSEFICSSFDKEGQNRIEEFFKNRTFKEQFLGILNYHEKPQKKELFLFRIYNLKLSNNDSFKYDRVTIISKNSKTLRTIKNKCKEVFYLKDFFNSPNFVIAFTEVEYHELKIGKERAIRRIQDAVNFMNNSLIQDGNLDSHTCITTADFKEIGGTKEFAPSTLKIDHTQLRRLNRTNTYEKLAGLNNISKQQFLQFEAIYHSAFLEKKISSFWHYIECIFLFGRDTHNGYKTVIDLASKILGYHFHKDYSLSYKLVIFNCLNGYMPKESDVSFSYKEANEIWNNFSEIDIKKRTERFDVPFIKEMNKALVESQKRKYKFKSQVYFEALFFELYEARNSFVHKGELSPRLEIKLMTVMPPLVKLLRNKIINGISNSKRRDLTSIINNLVKKY